MKEKTVNRRFLRVLSWSLLAVLLLTLAVMVQPSAQTFPGLNNNVVFAQEGQADDNRPGQDYCPDGVTSVPAGVDKIQFCRDNSQFPPVPDFVEDLWCRLIARFRMFKPAGLTYKVICIEEAPPLPPGIREVDFRIVTVIRDSDDQEIKAHRPPLLWKLINRVDFASPDDTVVLLRWKEDIEPARWEFIPATENPDGTIDYLINETSLFAVGLSDDPNIAQTFMAPETVIPAGLPRTGMATNSIPWGLGSIAVAVLAVIAAVGLWRWRGR